MDQEITNRLTYLKETLTRLSGIENANSDFLISDDLDEIEGDAYTFLHVNNLLKLQSSFNFMDDNLIRHIVNLRETVNDLPNRLWNVQLYKGSKEWAAIKSDATKALKLIDQD